MLPFMALIALAIGFFIYHFVFGTNRHRENIQSRYREIVANGITKLLGDNWSHSAHQHLPQRKVEGCFLFNRPIDYYRGDYLISGEIKGKHIEMSEIFTQTETPSIGGRKKYYEDTFNGLFIVVETNKKAENQLVLLPNSLFDSFDKMPLPEVAIDLKKLNKRYRVFSHDQSAATAILGNEFLEKLYAFEKLAGGEIFMELVGNQIYIAIKLRKPLLKTAMTTTLQDFKRVETYHNQNLALLEVIRAV
jgi:hypothetical protein